ncbi:hypothetical protein OCT63_17145 [Vibrio sp. RW]|uniref:hypothetical protein n=1 Tax=Vibrio sp. RW TaxID=2998833 RepID=UPI0022CDB311|nr:hypothetical protein [Vibrio sp. RW]MDA0145954.1 hypothetical protein [Vibrio sp. RW]
MITRYYAAQAHCEPPESPFVLVGEIVNHYSTGTQYVDVYSDDPKKDIHSLLLNPSFKLASKFKPTVMKNGVECYLKLHRKYNERLNVYLIVPREKPSIDIGDRLTVLCPDEVRNMTLKSISNL